MKVFALMWLVSYLVSCIDGGNDDFVNINVWDRCHNLMKHGLIEFEEIVEPIVKEDGNQSPQFEQVKNIAGKIEETLRDAISYDNPAYLVTVVHFHIHDVQKHLHAMRNIANDPTSNLPIADTALLSTEIGKFGHILVAVNGLLQSVIISHNIPNND